MINACQHSHLPKHNIGVHFLTAKTYRNMPYFADPACARIFSEELEAARVRYEFHVLAFVVMPDHVHLLLWWDIEALPELTISKIVWAVKGLSARRIVDYLKRMMGESTETKNDTRVEDGIAILYPGAPPKNLLQPVRQPADKPHYRNWRYKVWQKGAGYDFNTYTEHKLLEKATYIHANPVRAGLSATPEEYPWSSASYYACLTAKHPVIVTHIAEVL